MSACRPYLEKQIELIRPRVIVLLGATAVKGLLNAAQGISGLRGKWQKIQAAGTEIPVMPTYHPAALLRNPGWKRDVWSDMKELRRFLEKQT
jgi:DNA polymerase